MSTSNSLDEVQKLDLSWIQVRTVLVYVQVVLDQRFHWDVVLLRDGIANVPGPHNVGVCAILAFMPKAEFLYNKSAHWSSLAE
jgi:hypothetical protein